MSSVSLIRADSYEIPKLPHFYMNMSNGGNVRGSWNQKQGSWEAGENWEYVEARRQQVSPLRTRVLCVEEQVALTRTE